MLKRVSRKEVEVTRALGVLLYATHRQLWEYLGYADPSHVRHATSALQRRGWIKGEMREPNPSQRPRAGEPERVYSLTEDGKEYLRLGGMAVLPRSKHTRDSHRRHFQEHTLAITRTIILLKEYCERRGATVSQMEHDLFLKRDPIKIHGNHTVIPDLWVGLTLSSGKTWYLWFEIDRGTEREPKEWRAKIRDIVDAYDPACTRFGCTGFTVVIVTTTDERAARLKGWTEEELATWYEEYGQIFYYGLFDRPENFFEQPLWVVPFKTGGQRLIR